MLERQCGAEEEPRALQRALLFSSLQSAQSEKAPSEAWGQGRELSGERILETQIGTSISFWHHLWKCSQLTKHRIACWEVLASGPENSTPKINVLAHPVTFKVQSEGSRLLPTGTLIGIQKHCVIAKLAWPSIQLRFSRHSRKLESLVLKREGYPPSSVRDPDSKQWGREQRRAWQGRHLTPSHSPLVSMCATHTLTYTHTQWIDYNVI